MSEVHIRINKRALERMVFIIIILGLVAYIAFGPNVQPAADTQQVTSLQQQIQNLTADNQELVEQVETLQAQTTAMQEELQAEPEPAPEPEPVVEEEPTLSGELDFSYEAIKRNDLYERFVVVVDNGLEATQRLTITIGWNGLDAERSEEIVVQSGESETVIIEEDNPLPSYVPDNVDDIRIIIINQDDELVLQDWVQVY